MASAIDIFNAGGIKTDELVGEKGLYNNGAEIVSGALVQEKFIPNIDYSDPANFVKFGSAVEYYKNAINHIATEYPYDGSATEKLKWVNSLNNLEYHIFQNEIARSVGSVKLTGSQSIFIYSSVSDIETDAKNTYNSINSDNYNTYINFEDGMTFETWSKFDNSNAVDVLTITALSESGGSYTKIPLLKITGSSGYFSISGSSSSHVLSSTIDYSNWHHYAFRVSDDTVDLFIDGQFASSDTVVLNSSNLKSKFVKRGLVVVGSSEITPIPSSYGNTPVFTLGGSGTVYLDEVRFWEGFRSNEKIGRFWFTHVDGNE
jgi:hypothetical protein